MYGVKLMSAGARPGGMTEGGGITDCISAARALRDSRRAVLKTKIERGG
jgi:hypothetical protein